MADFCDEFVTWVKTVSAITSLIGTTTSCRCYPDQLKQGAALPALVFFESGGESVGYLAGSAGLCRTVLNTVAYGATRAAANALDEAVRIALTASGNNILMGSTYCTDISPSSYRDTGTDGVDAGSDAYRYWTHRVYDVWHSEPTS